MSLQARAIVIPGDDIDTDVLYPGTYLNVTEVEQMTHHLFEGLDPALRDQLGGDTALVVGSNFGCGSSREHVPQAMSASGIRFLVGKSFARIFYRNCINLGLPAVVSEADAVAAACARTRRSSSTSTTAPSSSTATRLRAHPGAAVHARDLRCRRARALGRAQATQLDRLEPCPRMWYC